MKTAVSSKNEQSSNMTIQTFKPEMSKLLDLTTTMINRGEIKTDIEFAKKFMFSFDSEEQFPINLELLVDMKVYDRKDHLKTKLLKIFEKDIDYKIEKATPENLGVDKKKGGSGLLKETITITSDCFKSLCMIANSEMGKQTKQYYLDLEKVFKTYIIIEFHQSQLQLQQETKEKNRILKLHNQMTRKHHYYKFNLKILYFLIK